MSQRRQLLDEAGLQVRSLSATYSPGTVLDPHGHDWGQLIYAVRGVMTVETASGCWVAPTHRAVWVPPGTLHTVAMSGVVAMRTLYFDSELSADLPRECRTLNVSPLLRELILETARIGMLHRDLPAQARLTGVILDRLGAIETGPLLLPMPTRSRLRAIAERLRAAPESAVPLKKIAAEAHMSIRSFERIFRAETNLTFMQWRQRMRLLHALRLLAAGTPVTGTAAEVGYSSTSAFIAAFKRELGTTPARYYAVEPGEQR